MHSRSPRDPSNQQISKAFEDLHEVMCMCFTYNKSGSLFHVKDANQLVNGQACCAEDLYYNIS